MPYLDEDILYNNVEEKYKSAKGKAREAYSDVLDTICEMPRADVVPKSEVERWKEINEQLYKEMSERNVEERKIERKLVAREIFEEIEKLSHRFMNDKHYIFGDMVWDIAELKKKYTEGE
jgi:hypothetical protein